MKATSSDRRRLARRLLTAAAWALLLLVGLALGYVAVQLYFASVA